MKPSRAGAHRHRHRLCGEGVEERGDHLRVRAADDHGGGLGVLEDALHLGGRQPVVHRHRGGAELVHRAVGDDPLQDLGALKIDGNQVPLGYPSVLQAPGQAVRLTLPGGEGESGAVPEVPVGDLVGVGRGHQPQLIGQQLRHGGRRRRGAPRRVPEEIAHGVIAQRQGPGRGEGPLHGQERVVRREQDPPPATAGAHEGDQCRMHVLGQVRRVREIEVRPLEQVLDEELLVRVAHVGADHHQIGEVDQDVFEQDRVLATGADPRTGDPDVDRDRDPELLAGGVDRIVERIVQRDLPEQGCDPDEVDAPVGDPGAQLGALAPGTFGVVHGGGEEEPVAMAGHERGRVGVDRG